MIIDEEPYVPTLPDEIIREIVNYIPITTEIRTCQAFLATSHKGLFYISESCKAFLSILRCYIKSKFVYTGVHDDVFTVLSTISRWLEMSRAFQVFHFHYYVDRCIFDKEIRIAPFLSFLRLTQSYIKECSMPSLFGLNCIIVTPIEYTLCPDTTIGFIYYADNENVVHALRAVDDVMVLQKPMSGGDWKKTLNYGGWLTKGRHNDHLEQVVYKGKFLLDEENAAFLSRCFYFGNDRYKAQTAYLFYNSAKEGHFQALLDQYPD